MFFQVFKHAHEIANLTLKPSKCNLVPSSLPWSPEIVEYIANWIRSNTPDWALFNIVPYAKYLGFIMGPKIKEVQWSGVFSKWLARGKAIAHSRACPGTSTFSYNHTGVPVLGYRGQLIELPFDIEMRERHLLHFLWHIPTNTFDLNTFSTSSVWEPIISRASSVFARLPCSVRHPRPFMVGSTKLKSSSALCLTICLPAAGLLMFWRPASGTLQHTRRIWRTVLLGYLWIPISTKPSERPKRRWFS